jgi:hypothetical protein
MAAEHPTCGAPLAPLQGDVVKKLVALALSPALIVGAVLGGGSIAGAQDNPQDQRVAPRNVTFTVTPGRDSKRPFKFRVRGRVGVPNQLPPQAQGCPPGVEPGNPYCKPQREKACQNGRVAIRYKTGKKLGTTISLRRAALKPGPENANPWFCTFERRVTFRNRKRFGGNRLKVTVRFLGNDVMEAKSARNKTVSVKPRAKRR